MRSSSTTFSFNVKVELFLPAKTHYLGFCPVSHPTFPVRFVLHATGGDAAPRNGAHSQTKRKYFSAHVQKDPVLGALVQSVNKMDLISALKFLKLEDISQGDSLSLSLSF